MGESLRARAALEPVYAELGLRFDPATVGSIEDEVPGISYEEVREALLAELARRHALRTVALDAALLARAKHLEANHQIDVPATARAEGRKLASEA